MIGPGQSFFRHPLSRVLGVDARVRVLRVLAEHGGLLTATDLIQRTELAPQSVRNALSVLLDTGVIERFGGERGAAFGLDAGHPLTPAMVSLFDGERKRVLAVHSAIQEAASGTGPPPVAVWIYGSVARGDDVHGSDLDILVVTADDEDPDRVADVMRRALRGISVAQRVDFALTGITESDLLRLADADDPFWRGLGSSIALRGPVPQALYARLQQKRANARSARDG